MGPVADRFGRVRTLMLTIICFSVFTLLSAFATNIWTLAVLRLLAGIGIGGEWGIGATLIAEVVAGSAADDGRGNDAHRILLWIFLAALANYFVGSRYGWRWMFVVGGVPALLVFLIRRGMSEPARWEAKQESAAGKLYMRQAFLKDFFAALPSAHAAQSDVPAGFDDRLVGRLGLRPGGDHGVGR